MNETLILILITLLSLKHFVVDYLFQKKYQYANKGIYGHPGGLLHAGLHGLGTIIMLSMAGFVAPSMVIMMGVLDAVIHYHVDWAKTNINTKMKWGPNTHDQFWWLLGLDQLLHTLTYILIIYLIV